MDSKPFELWGDILPLNEDVISFLLSRTSHGKMDHSLAVTKVANTIFDIWQKADCCPPSVPAIKKKVEKLMRDRKNCLTTFCPQVPDPKPELLQSTKRRCLPSIGRKASKRRIYSSGVISQESDIHKEVSSVFEMLLITLESEEDVCSKPVPLERKRLSLRDNCLPEQSWKKEIGLQLFVFSDTARKKSLASGFAFDEAFLLVQRRVFKNYTADRIVEAQSRHFIIKWNYTTRRDTNDICLGSKIGVEGFKVGNGGPKLVNWGP